MAIRDNSEVRNWLTTLLAAASVAILLAQQVFGAGGFWGRDTSQIAQLQQQFAGLSQQFADLSRKIEAGPSLNQVQDMAREMGVLEGRLDGYDQRLRNVETDDAATRATIQAIDAASKANLHR